MKLTKGKYWVGDPCYVIEDWDKIYKKYLKNDDTWQIYKDGLGVWFNTTYGDGCYPLCRNYTLIGKLGVDCGMLAFIPLDVVANDPKGSKHLITPGFKTVGRVIELEEDYEVEFNGPNEGNVTCGPFSIETDDIEEDDDVDFSDEEDDEV